MKKHLLLIIVSLVLSSCWDWNWNETDPSISIDSYSRYEPVIMTREDLENSIKIMDNQSIEESSKIYIIGDYIFVNDKRRGFHIFDNVNPENPKKEKFLNIPGATDISIRDGVLFVNQATDLVVLTMDFSSYSIQENKRIKNIFPNFPSPDGFYHQESENEIIVNYKEKM